MSFRRLWGYFKDTGVDKNLPWEALRNNRGTQLGGIKEASRSTAVSLGSSQEHQGKSFRRIYVCYKELSRKLMGRHFGGIRDATRNHPGTGSLWDTYYLRVFHRWFPYGKNLGSGKNLISYQNARWYKFEWKTFRLKSIFGPLSRGGGGLFSLNF